MCVYTCLSVCNGNHLHLHMQLVLLQLVTNGQKKILELVQMGGGGVGAREKLVRSFFERVQFVVN